MGGIRREIGKVVNPCTSSGKWAAAALVGPSGLVGTMAARGGCAVSCLSKYYILIPALFLPSSSSDAFVNIVDDAFKTYHCCRT